MQRKIFSLKGQIAFAGGERAPGVFVALVDADPDCDDLLGVGVTNDAGAFRLSFTAEAFNQETGEAEERPDLYLVASIDDGRTRIPVLRRDYPGLRFDDEEDLGTITLPIARGDRPTGVSGLRSAPGASKIVKRVHLDSEIVEIAANEVVRLVEHITGWRSLLDGARLEIVDSFDDVQRRRVARALGQTELSKDEIAVATRRAGRCDLETLALWDAADAVIHLNRPILEAQNYDALRVTLGHELVHVGQSRAHPELDAEASDIHSEVVRHALAGTEPSRSRIEAIARFLANIEGYATYIERLLVRYFTHGTTIWGARLEARVSLANRASPERKALNRANPSWREMLEDSATIKSSQYIAGYRAYAARARDDQSFAAFEPDLRPELVFDHATLELLEAGANLGDAPSQLELGIVLAEGKGGVPRDVEGAKRWFQRAADGGLAIGAYLHAAHLAADDPARVQWFRRAAEQGLSLAQRELALALLHGEHPLRDLSEALAWLEKAAEQGVTDAMRDLATIYEKGLGVPQDLAKARLWMKRAETANQRI